MGPVVPVIGFAIEGVAGLVSAVPVVSTVVEVAAPIGIEVAEYKLTKDSAKKIIKRTVAKQVMKKAFNSAREFPRRGIKTTNRYLMPTSRTENYYSSMNYGMTYRPSTGNSKYPRYETSNMYSRRYYD